ncbi:hypothetical protein L21SP2_3210 [Salinispira pacifica]|uniref:Uncharacterized protein n=1 Tax=Salinispira pacifica TaxID=1307761 RepID=V5WLR2_9SPIO|nr:hypothetical protein L21SP2_3210 [Salinispira pacifica]
MTERFDNEAHAILNMREDKLESLYMIIESFLEMRLGN